MRTVFQIGIACLVCATAVAGGILWLLESDPRTAMWRRQAVARPSPLPVVGAKAGAEPARRRGPAKPVGVFVDRDALEDAGIGIANLFTGPIRDPGSLKQLRDAVRVRSRVAREVLAAELDQFVIDRYSPEDQKVFAVRVHKDLALLLMYDGRLDEADAMLEDAQRLCDDADAPWKLRGEVIAMRGLVGLRRGEIENCVACVGPSSCIFPIAPEAAHKRQAGSREAVRHFTAYLDELPGDLRVRWLLNVAYMTLGEYPEKVPPKYLIPIDAFRSKIDVGRFLNVASRAGLTSRGPNDAGGAVFDDFTGDGLPDLFTTSLDADRGASFLVNKGDGTFEDRSDSAGLNDQVYALNVTRADFDNDGRLDVLLLRGAWEAPMRPSLLRNTGDGAFEDVTLSSGLGEPISGESAAWGDYDNDGFADVFVCGEYFPPSGEPIARPDPRNACRLYRNRGDGTFEDVAARAGVLNERCAKGSAWGDYNGDGRPDLFVSNMNGPSRLYHNDGDGTFRDVAPELGLTGGDGSFACWFWDFDNDGRPDLFVADNQLSLGEEAAIALGLPDVRPSHPRLFRNLGPEGFRDVASEVGLDRGSTPMGCNFADVDNDGFLDVYLGTGGMAYSHLVPNRMLKNVEGGRFEDVTLSSGTGHLQKGHGVSFADYDSDGDLDLFVEAGGGVPGDRAYNALFRNPGHGRHWLKVKLVGATTNRAALGARVRAEVTGKDGATRSIHRTIGDNSSFGGNSLVESLGLGDATRVDVLEISWPTSKTTQTFRDVAPDQAIEIREGADSFKSLPQPACPSAPGDAR